MSFGFRDKDRPSLRDRFRGKSGDQILEELRKKLDKDKEMFFDRVPNPPSFRRAGFPFDDDGLRSRGRPDFRHRLEELAQQHPEFADSLRPWYDEQPAGHQPAQPAHQPGDAAGPAFRQRTGSNSSQHQQQQHYQPEPQHHQQQQAEAHADGPQPGLAHHGLRNTVDLGEAQAKQMESEEERGKRAQSAPPAAEPGQQQRFVSRLDVHPQAGEQQGAASKPPAGPKQQQQQQPQPAGKASAGNVRQIPIFVEGRDEPVLARDDVDSSAANFGGGFPPHPQPHAGRSSPFGHQGFSRPHMGFPSFHGRDGFEQEAPAHKRPFPQQHHQPPPPPTRQQQQHQQQQQPPRQRTPPQQQQPQPQHPKPQAPPQQQQHQPPPPPPPQQQKPVDALDKVRAVQEEVESLSKQVDEFTGTRNDKQYLFLDEMLTRELIKLDVIETEGRDDVRAARKETIRNIQQCISRLEAKSGAKQEDAAESASSSEAMEVESSQQPSSESMEVDPASSQPSSQTVGDSKTEAQGANEAASTPAPAAAAATATPAQPETEAAATEQATSSSDCQTAAPKQGMDAVPTPVAATPTPADAASAPPAATSS